MADDPIDDFAAALFSAARRERPADGVRERVLAAMAMPDVDTNDAAPPESSSAARPVAAVTTARRPRFGVVFALAAAAAALAVVVFFRSRSEPQFSIGPERSARLDDMSPAPSLRNVEPEPTPEPVAPAPTAEKPARPRVTARAAHDGAAAQKAEPPPASLPEEIAALDRARTALSSGDVPGALRMLDDYERVLRGTRLTAEATMLRIDALARSGRTAEASALAARFVEANPSSALADRARAFIKTSNLSRVDAGGSQ